MSICDFKNKENYSKMKTSTKNLEKCQVELTVSLEAEETKTIIANVERMFVRQVTIPGFRKGKAPLNMVRSSFAAEIKQETFEQLVRKFSKPALEDAKVENVGITGVKDVSCGEEGGSFVLVVDVKPTFKLPTYKGLKIALNDTTVKQEDVDTQVSRIRKSNAKYVDAQEGDVLSNGDFAEIDYSGKIGEKPILEICPEAKAVDSAKNFWVTLDEGQFLPEILDALCGMKAGETKTDIVVKFDKKAAPDALKGKKATYTVTLNKFRKVILPSDAELAEKAKFETFENFVADVRAKMEKRAVELEATRRENAAAELLLKKVDFDVPQSLVHQQVEQELQEFQQRALYSGITPDYIEKNREQILKEAEEVSVRKLRLWYVFEAIAREEKIEAKPEEIHSKVMAFILANAKN